MAITVTPTVDLANIPPRIRLDVAASAGETIATPTRLNPDGTTSLARTADGNPLPLSAGVGLLYDYEPPYGQLVSYSSLETPGTVSAQVNLDPGVVWLIHTGVPALSMPIKLGRGSFTKRTRTAKQGVFWIMGRDTPIVQTDGARKSVQTSMVVLSRDSNEADDLEALTSDAGVLLLNIPASLGWNFGTCYVSVGDIDVTVVTDLVVEAWALLTMPFTVVDAPVGGSMAQRVLTDLMSYTSLTALQAAYPTLTAVLAGP